MHQLSVCLLALALSSASVEAQLGFGPCPDQPVVEDFKIDQYKGDWYEYSKYLSPDQPATECGKVSYSSAANELLDVQEETRTLGETTTKNGQLKKAVPANTDAKFTLRWGENPFEGEETEQTEVNYQVIETDYDNYAVLYNCQDFLLAHITDLNVYTRTRETVQTDMDDIYDTLQDRRINTLLLTRTNQATCDG